MKKFLVFFAAVLFACESDCVTCHPKLKELYNPHNKYYKEHAFLKECTKCHKSHPSRGDDKCGADCFECHSRQKLINTPIKAHQKLRTCTKCHKKEEILDLAPKSPDWLNLK